MATQTDFQKYRHYGVRLFLFVFFFSGVCRFDTDTCAVFYITKRACYEISVKCLFLGHNDVVPNTGIEPATLRSPARHSNQVSYDAVWCPRLICHLS